MSELGLWVVALAVLFGGGLLVVLIRGIREERASTAALLAKRAEEGRIKAEEERVTRDREERARAEAAEVAKAATLAFEQRFNLAELRTGVAAGIPALPQSSLAALSAARAENLAGTGTAEAAIQREVEILLDPPGKPYSCPCGGYWTTSRNT